MQLVAHLSRWMAAEGVAAGELTPGLVGRFIEARRAAGYRHFLMPSALAPLLGYLRALGVAPLLVSVSTVAPADLLVERYRDYLLAERGLATTTVRYYERVAQQFLGELSAPLGGLDLAGLTAGEVARFVLEECRRLSAGSASNVVVALRSLLRFLHLELLIGGELAAAVPAIAPRPRGLPRALEPGTVARLLASCDRHSATGRRDYAVLIVAVAAGIACR